MALIHWWPLNGDTKDYGLSPVSLSTFGTISFNNSGKIGKALELNGSNGLYYNGDIGVNNIHLVSAWFFVPSGQNNGWGAIALLNNNSGDSDTKFGLYACESTSRYQCQVTANGQYNASINYTAGSWHHLASTFDGSTLKGYLDGSLVSTTNITNSELVRTHFAIGCRSNSTDGAGSGRTTCFIGKLNDIRIYDHALTQKEVKELSKALVLHYDFEDEEIEGTINKYAYNPNNNPYWSSTFYDAATGKYGYNTDSNAQYAFVTAEDKYGSQKKMVKVSLRTARETRPYVHIDYLSGYMANNTWATVSLDMYSTCATSVGPYSYQAGYYFSYWDDTQKTWVGGTNTSVTIPNLKKNTWNHIVYRIYRDTADKNSGPGYLPVGTSSSTDDYWLFDNIQVELGKDHPTAYINGTRDAGIVYDASGYNYNGTQPGSLEITPDADIGLHSAFCNNSSNSNITSSDINLSGTEPFTLSCWVKLITVMSYQPVFWLGNGTTSQGICVHGAYANRLEGGNGFSTFDNENGSVLTYNQWTHMTYTWDGSNIKRYINGSLDYTLAWTAGFGSTLKRLYLGKFWGPASSLKLADFKIYATALSADDIRKEYQSMANIDKKYNLTSYKFKENSNKDDYALLSKNGVFEANSINEFNVPGYTRLEYIQSDGNQWIDSETVINLNTDSFEIVAQATTSDQNGMIIGDWADGNYWWLYHYKSGSRIGLWYINGSNSQQNFNLGLNSTNLNKNKFVYKNGNMYVNDGAAIAAASGGFANSTHPCTLFKVSTYSYKGRIYYCRLYKSGKLVRHFIPVRDSYGAVGLYDLVHSKFYANKGSGSFTAGPECTVYDSWTDSDITTDYVPTNIFKTYDDGKLVSSSFSEGGVNGTANRKKSILEFVPNMVLDSNHNIVITNWDELDDSFKNEGLTFGFDVQRRAHQRNTISGWPPLEDINTGNEYWNSHAPQNFVPSGKNMLNISALTPSHNITTSYDGDPDEYNPNNRMNFASNYPNDIHPTNKTYRYFNNFFNRKTGVISSGFYEEWQQSLPSNKEIGNGRIFKASSSWYLYRYIRFYLVYKPDPDKWVWISPEDPHLGYHSPFSNLCFEIEYIVSNHDRNDGRSLSYIETCEYYKGGYFDNFRDGQWYYLGKYPYVEIQG